MDSRLSRTGSIAACLSLALACGGSNKNAPSTASPAPNTGAGIVASAGVGAAAGTVAGVPAAVGGVGGSSIGGAGTGVAGSVNGAAGVPAAVSGSSGSLPGSAGMSAPPVAGAASPALDMGNYFASGTWKGYAWTSAQGAGSTITPMDFSPQTTGMPRCVKGSVAATADYSGTASLGFNLNQEQSGNTTLTVTPSKSGVELRVKNNGSSALRFQVESQAGGTSTRWCADITGTGGFIAWSSLNTKCWDGTGMAYNKEPITSASVIVPGMNMAAVPFDFCIESLAEADGPPPGTAAGSGGASSTAGAGGSGEPPIPTPPGGCTGFATRYWDCCKPHCGWSGNVPQGVSPLAACSRDDNSLGGDFDARNACEAGGTAHLCHGMVPWAVNDELSYGYSAVAASSGDICGKCYELQFTGVSHNAGADPGSTALRGKKLVVMAINVGGDVGSGQFDVSIPGGGVGLFDACSSQWGVQKSELGEQYGGFLATCKKQHDRTDHAALKGCVMQSCMNVFEARGLSELAAGCRWFVDWFQVADNPALNYKEVACPNELVTKGVRRPGNPGNACVR